MMKWRMPARLMVVAAILLSGSACSLGQAALQDTRDLELAIAPDASFTIEVGAGSMRVEGVAGADRITVRAEIYQHRANDDYTLALESTDDGHARLRAHPGKGWNRDHIDLTIRVPDSLKLRIDDGSGSIEISNLAGPVQIDDGSGSLRIDSIDGPVRITDGSGSLRANDIAGDLTIDDGSGSITIDGVQGAVQIIDGSGSIAVSNVSGKVTISDGSGSINVDTAGDFELVDDGSGSVNLINIGPRGGG